MKSAVWYFVGAALALGVALAFVQVERQLESCEYAVRELKIMHGEALDALEQCVGGYHDLRI